MEKIEIAVIGAGPSGLMAAEVLSARGSKVTVFERMPSPGRKFLMAGRGGLNLTHSENFETFVTRYDAPWIAPILKEFPPGELIRWAHGLGQKTFTGSSGRVFPKAMKASPLLRAWLGRLANQGVEIRTRHEWLGWDDDGCLRFDVRGEQISVQADACILALGGASWPRLGSNGAWVEILQAKGIGVTALKPANCGFLVNWSAHFRDTFAGHPLKSAALSFAGNRLRGEVVITASGLEGGGVYAFSRALREEIAAKGSATLTFDLRPDMTQAEIVAKLAAAKRGTSVANLLRKSLHLAPVAINLMREAHGIRLPAQPEALALLVKSVPLKLIAPAPIGRAISSAGGIAHTELGENLMLRALPGVFAAGEMLDWEAPTGGYLLTACFATGVAAAKGVLQRMKGSG